MSGPRILLWDLENTPGLGYFWGKTYNTNIIEVAESSRVMCWAAKWYGAPKNTVEFRSTFHDGTKTMLERISALLDEADATVTYNGAKHDTPHISTEFLREGIEIPSPYRETDLYRVTSGKLKLHSNRLQSVLGEFGFGSKIEHEGFKLWLKCMAGDELAWQRMKRYCIGDVVKMEPVYNLYRPLIPQAMSTNFNLYCDGDVCPRCGSSKIVRRGKQATSTALYPRYRCSDCGKWSRGKTAIKSSETDYQASANLRGAA